MSRYISILLFLFTQACSIGISQNIEERVIEVSPGHVRFVSFPFGIERKITTSKLVCAGKSVPLEVGGGKAQGYWAQGYFTKVGKKECHLYLDSKKSDAFKVTLNVVPYNYPSETLTVDRKRVSLNKKDLARVQKEQSRLNKIYKSTPTHYYFTEEFGSPLDYNVEHHKLTSHYGKRRVFNGTHKGQHLGNDYRAKMNSPIPASNKGQVVLADDLFYSGKTVILNHGLGIFTMYGHLNKINVGVGQFVKKNQILGLSGMSGRVTGPHLHWGVKIHGNWVDGITLIDESKKQFISL